DHRISFEDSNTYYQFSFEECHAKTCEFQDEGEWQNGVRLLLQLVPYVPVQTGMSSPSITYHTGYWSGRKAALVQTFPQVVPCIMALAISWDCGLRYLFSLSSALQQGGFCALRNKEDVSRLEMVQKLAKDGCRFLQTQGMREGEDETEEEEWSSSRSLSSVDEDPADSSSSTSSVSDRYVVMSGTPERILEHLLSDLQLDGNQEMTQCKEADMLLDDFLLTYLVFMSTSDLCQALLGQYLSKHRGKEEGKEALYRKRKVLHLVSQWTGLYRDFLREEEHVKIFMKTLYRYVLDDLYEFPSLEKDLKEFQKLLLLFHQTSVKENWLQSRGAQREKEVFCHVYVTVDSYFSVKIPVTAVTQEVLDAVADRMEGVEEDLALVTVSYSGGNFSVTLSSRPKLWRKDRGLKGTIPLTDNTELQQRPVRMLSMNTWDVAVALTNFDWSLFNSVHEQELVYYTVSRQASGGRTAALELLLQRCNEVQLWVMTEVLLCSTPAKRVQLLKKFVKIAAHCKAQRNLNSFFAIIMGLNTAAVSRLSQTWEKVPGKFRKLFSELEMLTDPSMNHKVYRDTFKKMKPPKIPFMPLLLKDITFIHEGNKTFLDNLVNFEKLHMIADAVRLIRHCQMDHMGEYSHIKESPEVRSYISCLHIIDNQQTLFELSHRLEPRV
uniref:Rap guanine nucleotide exchange factor 5 n=1 Tax=Scleropages formosus TaxID=113540 RepID=A0A8C9QXN5_SCLFO